ncbi:MAG: rRNA maturation RNase YbeY [Candidatus Hydrogenedentota bacterium]|nr:MAG: rRNA maturation RNase YbeY [Candidatus Hydrogenedentota bacterium]
MRRVLQCEIRARGLPPDCEDGITVRLVDDATMRSFNSRYKQRRTTTDVLAFSTGDILISLDRASVQARDENHSVRREVLHLALHGWLHLNGFRDARPDEAARMEREIEEILNRFPKLRKAQSRRRALKRTGA